MGFFSNCKLWNRREHGAPWKEKGLSQGLREQLICAHYSMTKKLNFENMKFYFLLLLSGCFPLHWQPKKRRKEKKRKEKNKIPFEIQFPFLWQLSQHLIWSNSLCINYSNKWCGSHGNHLISCPSSSLQTTCWRKLDKINNQKRATHTKEEEKKCW